MKSQNKQKGLREILTAALAISRTAKRNNKSLSGGNFYSNRFQEHYAEALLELRGFADLKNSKVSVGKLKQKTDSFFDASLGNSERAKILTEIFFELKSEIEPALCASPSAGSVSLPALHPAVLKVARSRFETKHYADAVEAAFKEINLRVKAFYKKQTGDELDGVPLMRQAFRRDDKKAIISLGDLETETGRNMQQGYMEIFAGSMAAIRNPKAHGNISIDADRAIHFLYLASLQMHKLDEAGVP